MTEMTPSASIPTVFPQVEREMADLRLKTLLQMGEFIAGLIPCPDSPRRGLKYTVTIRKNATGEVRTCDMGDVKWNGQDSLWWWTEGNFACDCNRETVFEQDFDAATKCSEGRFTVIHADLADGRRVLIDAPE